MTAPNHALTGAVIGLSVTNPVLACILAFISHFICDAIPHYDPPGSDSVAIMTSKGFITKLLVAGAGLCALIVFILFLRQPHNWLLAAVCAFLATAPDLFWLPRYLHVKRTGTDINLKRSNLFWRLHAAIQWKTSPSLWKLEAIYAIVVTILLWQMLV